MAGGLVSSGLMVQARRAGLMAEEIRNERHPAPIVDAMMIEIMGGLDRPSQLSDRCSSPPEM